MRGFDYRINREVALGHSHRQIHKTLDHLPSLVVEAGLEQVRPFCCWYSTITLVSYVHKYAFPFFSSKLR